jgi:CubicO group peptidase (beta-lactamase class C family)
MGGYADKENKKPITADTMYFIYSASKVITCAAALHAYEEGYFRPVEPVSKYLPEFKDIKIITANGETKPSQMPTVRSLLNHTSGIATDASKLVLMTERDKQTLDASIDFFIRTGLDFQPGSQQAYSPTGAFDVLTRIIEKVSGVDYLTFLQREIFTPCGMVDTTFMPNAEQQGRMVEMHTNVNGENAVRQMMSGCVFEDIPSTHYLGGAGLVSTLQDYAQFAKMLLNKGKTDTGAIISEQTFQQLCTPQVSQKIMPGDTRWGLGVRVITKSSYPYLSVGAFGWSGAYGTHFWVDPVNKTFAVFMKNSAVDGGSGNESAVKFEEAVFSSFVR